MFCDVVKDDDYYRMRELSTFILNKFMEHGLCEGADNDYLSLNKETGLWEQSFQPTLMHVNKKRINAHQIIKDF